METLCIEYIDYMACYRVFRAGEEYQTIAYVDSIEEAQRTHPEYNYKEVK